MNLVAYLQVSILGYHQIDDRLLVARHEVLSRITIFHRSLDLEATVILCGGDSYTEHRAGMQEKIGGLRIFTTKVIYSQ